MTAQKCTYCSDFAESDTTPPLCPVHLDLDILVDFTLGKKERPTLETIQRHYRFATGNNGGSSWSLTGDQIARLLPGYLAGRGLAVEGQQKEASAQNADLKSDTPLNGDDQ
jgi:hypothetical protein